MEEMIKKIDQPNSSEVIKDNERKIKPHIKPTKKLSYQFKMDNELKTIHYYDIITTPQQLNDCFFHDYPGNAVMDIITPIIKNSDSNDLELFLKPKMVISNLNSSDIKNEIYARISSDNNLAELIDVMSIEDRLFLMTKLPGITTDNKIQMLQAPDEMTGIISEKIKEKINAKIPQMDANLDTTAKEIAATAETMDELLPIILNNIEKGVGFNGATLEEIKYMMNLLDNNKEFTPKPKKNNAYNNTPFTSKLSMKFNADIGRKIYFISNISALKSWGNNTGLKFDNNFGEFSYYDDDYSTQTNGDTIYIDRASFNFIDSPWAISIGRRPIFRNNIFKNIKESKKDDTFTKKQPADVINWQFDGVSIIFDLERIINFDKLFHFDKKINCLPKFQLCYGKGFDTKWGNNNSLNSQSTKNNVTMFGSILTLFENKIVNASLTYIQVPDVTDGFTGLTVMPFFTQKNNDGTYIFHPNYNGFILESAPKTKIGEWKALSLSIDSSYKKINFFASFSMNFVDPKEISKKPFYEIFEKSLLSSNNNLDAESGNSIYLGINFPIQSGQFGLEYNHGSEYWYNFTAIEDSIVSNDKLSTRGDVIEMYYTLTDVIPDLQQRHVLKLGGHYFKYNYSGSGNPLGKPIEISQATIFDSLTGIPDTLWDIYVSLGITF